MENYFDTVFHHVLTSCRRYEAGNFTPNHALDIFKKKTNEHLIKDFTNSDDYSSKSDGSNSDIHGNEEENKHEYVSTFPILDNNKKEKRIKYAFEV